MPMLPAFCDNSSCRTIFASGFVIENCANVTLSGNKAGPCPKCGGWGSIPDGVFNVMGDVVTMLTGTAKSVESLQRLNAIINGAKNRLVTPEELSNNISEEVPEFNDLSSYFPKTRMELYTFIIMLAAVLTLLISSRGGSVEKEEIQDMIDEAIEKNIEMPSVQDKPKGKKKIGRNEPCYCGSGKKYKRCCLV